MSATDSYYSIKPLTQGNRKIEILRVAITTTPYRLKKEEPFLITREEVDITGMVGDIDEAGFMHVDEMAKTMCAVGLALKGNVMLDYKVHFEA